MQKNQNPSLRDGYLIGIVSIMFVLLMAASQCAEPAPAQEARGEQRYDMWHPNTITALIGYGPDGLQITEGGHRVEPFQAPLIGLQYSYRIDQEWSVYVQGMTGVARVTKTRIFAGGAGYSF